MKILPQRSPQWQALTYGMRHAFIVMQWTVSHSSVDHKENMPYPVWKSCRTGVRNFSNNSWTLELIHVNWYSCVNRISCWSPDGLIKLETLFIKKKLQCYKIARVAPSLIKKLRNVIPYFCEIMGISYTCMHLVFIKIESSAEWFTIYLAYSCILWQTFAPGYLFFTIFWVH